MSKHNYVKYVLNTIYVNLLTFNKIVHLFPYQDYMHLKF